jgi:hypothetical protein
VRWADIQAEQPEFAARAQAFMDGGVHKTIATLRRDGSPRISGIESSFTNGDLWFSSMPGAVKARDLQRDPRFALHSASVEQPAWVGDAKFAGVVVEVQDRAELEGVPGAGDAVHAEAHFFRADISEVVVVTLREDRKALVIESWHVGRGLERIAR